MYCRSRLRISVKMASLSREIRLQVTDSGRCSPATISRASLIGSTESIRRSLQMEMDSIRAEQVPETVGRTLSNYVTLKVELQSDMEWLSMQQEQLDEASSEVEPLTVWVMGSWGALETMKGHRDDAMEYTQRKDAFNKKLLILKIQAVCVKLAYISSVIRKLQELASKDSRLQTPTELQFAGYDDWVENNQQVFQLQSKMLEIEADKVRLYKDFCVRHRTRTQAATSKHSFSSQLEMQFGREPEVELTQHRLQEMVGEDADATHISYLDTILCVSESNLSFEACKLKSYIRECWDVQVIDESFPTGVHPDRYQEFVGSLCQYIVDKHSVGRCRLTYDIVYARLEHHLLPAINPLLVKYISRPEEDKRIKQICDNLRYVTQAKLGIEPECQDTSAAPYYAAVAALKGISLSLTPTKKTYNIVKAAQAVFNRLNEKAIRDNRRPPGADEFMDVWVYAVLKASIPNLGSTVALLKRYSNPSLAFSEAGYYLASVEFATQYILRMNEQDLSPNHGLLTTNLVVCEQKKFARLAAQEDALVEIVSPSEWLTGYQLFAVKEWQLNPVRFYSTILVPVDDPEEKVRVTVIRVSVTGAKSAQIGHLEKVFLTPELSHTGLSRARTPLGLAITADLTKLNETLTLIPLHGGDYEQFSALVHRYCSLERLGLTSGGDSFPREHRVQGNTLLGSTGNQNEAAENGKESQRDQLFEEQSFQYHNLDQVNREVAKALRRLCSNYNLSQTSSHDSPLEYLISSTSSMLQDLGYFSVLLEANGVYSDLLLKAVQQFQRDYNSRRASTSEDIRLVETGCITSATWGALRNTLQRAVTNLHRLGFVYSGDALSRTPTEHARFRQFVSDCQAAMNLNVLVRGTIGKTTLGEVEARLSNSSWSL